MMTRLIDADALSEKLCETTIFIKDGEVFQRMINDAPTVKPNGDLISRQDAINACLNGWNKGYDEILTDIRALPSEDRPTGEWVSEDGTPSGAAYSVYCSRCGQWSEYRGFFCLWCGAKMERRENDGR